MLGAKARACDVKLRHTELSIPAEGVWLDGRLAHAPDVRALVVIACANHPGSTNEAALAGALQAAGFATLLLDLLTHHEAARDPDAHFNIPRLANRLLGAADWIGHQPALAALAIGLIGSATTSAAIIRAAWKAPQRFGALVCAGGRPDLAGATPLQALATPVRIVIGGDDPDAAIAAPAFERIGAKRDWQRIAGAATPLAEPATTASFARLVIEWFALELPPADVVPDPSVTTDGAPATTDR